MLTLLLCTLFSLTFVSRSLSCTAQYQCDGVTNDYNYVSCASGACACRTNLGFQGAATTASKCGCPSPYYVIWKTVSGVSTPFCVQLQDAVDYKLQQDRTAKNRAVLEQYLTYLFVSDGTKGDVYNVSAQLAAGTTDHPVFGLFDPNVKFRMDALGEFYGRNRVLQFQFGQHANGQAFTNQFVWKNFLGEGNRISGEVSQFYTLREAPPPETAIRDAYNVTHHGIWTFTDDNKILSFDGGIRNLDWIIGDVFENQTEWKDATCLLNIYVGGCTEFASYAACRAFQDSIPYGDWNNLRRNSVLCRFFHSVPFSVDHAPAERCANVGPSATDWCYDRDSTTFYDTGFDSFDPTKDHKVGSIPPESLGFKKKRSPLADVLEKARKRMKSGLRFVR